MILCAFWRGSERVAHALARKFNWHIQPAGDAALNLLGLSTQVPVCWIYLSDGPSREYEAGSHALALKQSALKNVGFKYRESGLVTLKAPRACGSVSPRSLLVFLRMKNAKSM